MDPRIPALMCGPAVRSATPAGCTREFERAPPGCADRARPCSSGENVPLEPRLPRFWLKSG
eukprot:6575838-Prymnesium_polylepis.1